jgi:hypothetical protein
MLELAASASAEARSWLWLVFVIVIIVVVLLFLFHVFDRLLNFFILASVSGGSVPFGVLASWLLS